MSRERAGGAPPLGVVVLAVATGACGGLDMQQHYQAYRNYLVSGDYERAASYIETSKEEFYGEKNRLLYYMDKALVLSLAGKLDESNALLEKAKTAAEELWTESIGENAEAWITTDNSLSYQGEDFEKVLLHFVAARNYLALGDYGAARVEARQITAKLELYNSKYEEEHKNVYKDDAFARWLAGKLAETEGREGINDAWIDYQKAIEIYETDYQRYGTAVPTELIADAMRVLDGLGPEFADDLAGLKARYPSVEALPYDEAARMGHVVLLHSGGEAPYKVDEFWEEVIDGDILRIAFPTFIANPHAPGGAQLVIGDARAPAELAEDVTAIAIQNLADKMDRIKAKAIARAVIKFTAGKATQVAGDAVGGTAGSIMNLAGSLFLLGTAAAEEADKRSWITLPSAVYLAQRFVPLKGDAGEAAPNPGVCADTECGWRAFGGVPLPAAGATSTEVVVEVGDGSGRELVRKTIDLVPGQTVFLSTRTFD